MSQLIDRNTVFATLVPVFGELVHEKRILSLALGTLGVLYTRRVSVAEIGRALAGATGKSPKHGIKQIDRFLSNRALKLDSSLGPMAAYVPWVVGERKEIYAALDWTDFDADGQTTLMLSLITSHGRSTPLVWRTVRKKGLKNHRNEHEDDLLRFAASVMPKGVNVTILADRAFGDTKLYELLHETLGWDFVIRFRGCINVGTEETCPRPASEWLFENGRARRIDDALVTHSGFAVSGVVCVKKKDMKEAWFLATSRADLTADEVVELYSRRFTIEESFRDDKDDRFGIGLSEATIGTPARRDRLLLLLALARIILTSLGAAGEQLGLDAKLRANTEQTKRTHSLITQGRLYAVGIGVFAALASPLLCAMHGILGSLAAATHTIGVI